MPFTLECLPYNSFLGTLPKMSGLPSFPLWKNLSFSVDLPQSVALSSIFPPRCCWYIVVHSKIFGYGMSLFFFTSFSSRGLFNRSTWTPTESFPLSSPFQPSYPACLSAALPAYPPLPLRLLCPLYERLFSGSLPRRVAPPRALIF